MFDSIHQQNLADMMKAHLLRIATPQERKTAIATLQQFERSRWVVGFFNQAVEEIAPGRFSLESHKLAHDGKPAEAQKHVLQILERYLELLQANTLEPKPSEWIEGAR